MFRLILEKALLGELFASLPPLDDDPRSPDAEHE
jgi:hypothetical protein